MDRRAIPPITVNNGSKAVRQSRGNQVNVGDGFLSLVRAGRRPLMGRS